MQMLSGPLKKRIAGMLLMALGVGALSAPLTVGRWSLAALGIPLMVLSVAEAYAAFRSPQHDKIGAYLPSVLALLAGNLLILSSALVLSGLQVVLVAILVIDGLSKILRNLQWSHGLRPIGVLAELLMEPFQILIQMGRSRPPSERVPTIVSGLVDFACAALLWYLGRIIGAELAVGVVIGAYISASGWRMLMAPAEAAAPDTTAGAPTVHPDPGLGLPPNEAFAQLHAEIDSAAHTVRATDLMWMLTLGGVFLAIHVGRMPMSDTLLGVSSPFIATAGDVLMTFVFATLLVLPWRLLWRRSTRLAERLAWSLHLGSKNETAPLNRAADWLLSRWLASRFSFDMWLREARVSLSRTLILLLRLGLPVTAFFVAFNPIWGFNWYFNTESWATGVYQKMTELRVNSWRVSMIDAETRAYRRDGDELFRIRPDGVDGTGDFSFLVIGDPGEGDASQYSLTSHYLTDALEGFNANFLEPLAARAAIAARVATRERVRVMLEWFGRRQTIALPINSVVGCLIATILLMILSENNVRTP